MEKECEADEGEDRNEVSHEICRYLNRWLETGPYVYKWKLRFGFDKDTGEIQMVLQHSEDSFHFTEEGYMRNWPTMFTFQFNLDQSDVIRILEVIAKSHQLKAENHWKQIAEIREALITTAKLS